MQPAGLSEEQAQLYREQLAMARSIKDSHGPRLCSCGRTWPCPHRLAAERREADYAAALGLTRASVPLPAGAAPHQPRHSSYA